MLQPDAWHGPWEWMGRQQGIRRQPRLSVDMLDFDAKYCGRRSCNSLASPWPPFRSPALRQTAAESPPLTARPPRAAAVPEGRRRGGGDAGDSGSSLEGQPRRGGGGWSRGASRRSPVTESRSRGRSGFQAPSSPSRHPGAAAEGAGPAQSRGGGSLQPAPLTLAARGGPHCSSGGLTVPANTSLPRPPLPVPFPTVLPAHQLCSVWRKQVSIPCRKLAVLNKISEPGWRWKR